MKLMKKIVVIFAITSIFILITNTSFAKIDLNNEVVGQKAVNYLSSERGTFGGPSIREPDPITRENTPEPEYTIHMIIAGGIWLLPKICYIVAAYFFIEMIVIAFKKDANKNKIKIDILIVLILLFVALAINIITNFEQN